MPNLFELLPQHDKDLIYKYISNYADVGGSSYQPTTSLEYLMRYWNNEKQNLYKMLGNNFIVSKRVSYSRSAEAVANRYHFSVDYMSVTSEVIYASRQTC